MTDERVAARVFGEVAEEYDRIRPSYPARLVDDVIAYAAETGATGPVLEVGAGTGRATALFAGRGIEVTAVEPDPAMVAVLRRNVAGLPVTVAPVAFEEHEPALPYRLIVSAQAWHWTDEATRWSRAARMLAPAGALALFWNGDEPADPAVREVFEEVHRRHVPDMSLDRMPLTEEAMRDWWAYRELDAAPGFGAPELRLYRSVRELSTADHLAMLDTVSRYRLLDDGVRAALFADLRAGLGERLAFDVDTVLLLARRESSGVGSLTE
jgi:SAM-dependent methyltransferase